MQNRMMRATMVMTMNDRIEKYAIVRVWKLHTDTGKHMPELPSKYVDGEEVRYFKVEGKNRPAIVWTSNSETAKLIMLTKQASSRHGRKLADVVGSGIISYFNPDKQEWKRYPYELIESEGKLLSDEHKQLLLEALNQHSMSSNSPGASS